VAPQYIRDLAGGDVTAGGLGSDTPDPSTVHLDLPTLEGRRSLREEVARALRAALVAGQMRPGVTYSAPALAAQFGVSPTPVREAMLDLAKEGLVEVVRNKGFRITELSDRDLDEITDLRALIEIPTVTRLVGVVPASRFNPLRPLADAIVEAAERGDLVAYVEADRRFHLDLLGLAGNEHLVEVVGDLRNRSRLYGLDALIRRGVLTKSANEHEELLDLLVAGDAEAVEELMRRHLRHVRGIWAERPER
jgi:DNA-binding GntR family transcriptional regulator